MINRSSLGTRRRRQKKVLFEHQREILNLIFKEKAKGYVKNKIFEVMRNKERDNYQTGFGYKRNILDSIDALEENGLVKIEKIGKQKEFVTISELGKEVIELTNAIDKYDLAYSKLILAYRERLFSLPNNHIDLIDKEIRKIDFPSNPMIVDDIKDSRMFLLSKGWKKQELNFFTEIRSNLIGLKIICDKNYLFILTQRFSKILIKYNTNRHSISKFIGYLILRSLEKRITLVLENFEEEIQGFQITRYTDNNPSIITTGPGGGIFQLFEEIYSVFFNKIISFSLRDEIEEMVFSYLELLQAPLENVDISMLNELKQLIGNTREKLATASQIEEYLSPVQVDKIDLINKTTTFFFEICLKYAKEKEMRIITFDY
jgi:hypothetical protein